MTELTTDDRIAALMASRAGKTANPAHTPGKAVGPKSPGRRRRRHAAAGARWLAAGIGASVGIGLVGGMAAAAQPTTAETDRPVDAVVIRRVVVPTTGSSLMTPVPTSAETAVTAAPAPATITKAPAPAPITTSQGS
jgi:hypothetical protein